MEVSKPPTDVLALGKHLVRELELAEGVDTLAKWMSHHLAELIRKADTAATPEEREKAAADATATILKIWEHRKALPYDAYPLASYEQLLRLVGKLVPDGNPFKFPSSVGLPDTDRIAARLFDNLTRLILTLLFMNADKANLWKIHDEAGVEALDADEKHILESIHGWLELLPVEKKGNPSKTRKKPKATPKLDLKKNAITIIQNLRIILDELEGSLKPEKQ